MTAMQEAAARREAEEEAAKKKKAEEEAAARREAEEEAAKKKKAEQPVVSMPAAFGWFSPNASVPVVILNYLKLFTVYITLWMTSSEVIKYLNAETLHSIALKTKTDLMARVLNLLVDMGTSSIEHSSKFIDLIYTNGLFLIVYDQDGNFVRMLRILPPMKPYIVRNEKGKREGKREEDIIKELIKERIDIIRRTSIDYLTNKETFREVFGTLEPEDS